MVPKKSFVAEVEWTRSEELRPTRLGPSADDLDEKDETYLTPVMDFDRPLRTLGPWTRH